MGRKNKIGLKEGQPRPQGFSLKKGMGQEKPWGRG